LKKEERFCVDETLKHIRRVQELLGDIATKLHERGIYHDKSKMEDPEFRGFVEFTPKLKDCTYGSDEYKSFLNGMKPFLDHHYKFNSHHPENSPGGFSDMSIITIMETLSDWRAASERHSDGDIRKSIEINQKSKANPDGRFVYSDELKKIMLNTVDEMGW